jgi:two-component system chemotaxis response regulator CheB
MGIPNRLYQPMQPAAQAIRVLIVDDSAFMRFTISKFLSEAPGLLVVGTARDGQEALDLIPKLKPDVITLDVEMPRMDGLTTLREIMAEYPRPVIMLSSLTKEGALETVQALTFGAVDFVTKPTNKANMASVMDDLLTKIIKTSKAKVWQVPKTRPVEIRPAETALKTTRPLEDKDRVVVIGASTGGPRALSKVVSGFSKNLSAAMVIVQHMPVGFTRSLAERLDTISSFVIKEGEPGDNLEVGRCLVAPGGFHMVLDEHNAIALNQNPTVHGVRPAIDVTMTSIVQHFGAATIGVILTGMGNDGTNGSALIHSSGGQVIAEDESTCVVWGMPRSVAEAGVADVIVPIDEVAPTIEKLVRSHRSN